jgi:hypothetical protein
MWLVKGMHGLVNSINPIPSRDVAVTVDPQGRRPSFDTSSSATECSFSTHANFQSSQTEFDWIENTNPFQRLRNLLTLENNWDGYGAPKFTRDQVSKAFDLYSSVYGYYLSKKISFTHQSPFVAPCSDGSILFEWVGQRFPVKELEIFVPSIIANPFQYLKSSEKFEEEGDCSLETVTGLLDWLFASER